MRCLRPARYESTAMFLEDNKERRWRYHQLPGDLFDLSNLSVWSAHDPNGIEGCVVVFGDSPGIFISESIVLGPGGIMVFIPPAFCTGKWTNRLLLDNAGVSYENR